MTAAIGAFGVPPESDSYRMVAALPSVMVLAGFGADALTRRLTAVAQSRIPVTVGVPACLVATVFSINFRTYYGDYAGNCLFANADADRFAFYLGDYVRRLDPDVAVYLLSDENFWYGTHLSVDFLSGGRSIVNYSGDVSTIGIGRNTAVVAVPSREDEVESWARKHPGGRYLREHHCDDLILVAYLPPEPPHGPRPPDPFDDARDDQDAPPRSSGAP